MMELRMGEIFKVGLSAILVIALVKWGLTFTPYGSLNEKF